MTSNTSLLAILSGGLDSATALAVAKDLLNPGKIGAVHFEYTQTNRLLEGRAFDLVCDHFSIAKQNRYFLWLPPFGRSALTTTKSEAPPLEGVPITFVPNRNMVLIARAAAQALEFDYDALCIGVHEEDSPYPDCSSAFVNTMKRALSLATAGAVSLYAPVIKMSKAAIVRAGKELGVPFEHTWTCYHPRWLNDEGTEAVACGECTACKLRLAAFKKNGLQDPVLYQQDLQAKGP